MFYIDLNSCKINLDGANYFHDYTLFISKEDYAKCLLEYSGKKDITDNDIKTTLMLIDSYLIQEPEDIISNDHYFQEFLENKYHDLIVKDYLESRKE